MWIGGHPIHPTAIAAWKTGSIPAAPTVLRARVPVYAAYSNRREESAQTYPDANGSAHREGIAAKVLQESPNPGLIHTLAADHGMAKGIPVSIAVKSPSTQGEFDYPAPLAQWTPPGAACGPQMKMASKTEPVCTGRPEQSPRRYRCRVHRCSAKPDHPTYRISSSKARAYAARKTDSAIRKGKTSR